MQFELPPFKIDFVLVYVSLCVCSMYGGAVEVSRGHQTNPPRPGIKGIICCLTWVLASKFRFPTRTETILFPPASLSTTESLQS